MKHTAMLVLAAVLLLGLAGCGSRYVLVTNDYAIHIATSKPELDGNGDTLSFKDEDGKEVKIPRQDLKHIRELRD